MIHFDFTVTDEEAETIFDCIREEILNYKTYLLEYPELPSERIEWYEGRIVFLENLITKMTNMQVYPNKLHPSHVTRISDASSFDEICVNCGATDIAGGGWGQLRYPCDNPKKEI